MFLSVDIPGLPVGQGSKRHVGRGAMVESSKALAPWRKTAIACIRDAMGEGWEPMSGPVMATVTFTFPRPKAHYGTGRNAAVLKPSAPEFKASAPDLDKLLRAWCDAMTQAGAWRDDALLVKVAARKGFGLSPGILAVVEQVEP